MCDARIESIQDDDDDEIEDDDRDESEEEEEEEEGQEIKQFKTELELELRSCEIAQLGKAANMTVVTRPRVVIVGAGFGGLWATRRLVHSDVEVWLLDRNN